MQANEEDDKIV